MTILDIPGMSSCCVSTGDYSTVKTLMTALATLLAIFGMGSSNAAVDALRARELATQNSCLGCHAVAIRLVGPAYAEVAAKYKNVAPAQLAARIKSGGTGQWGMLEMPAQTALSETDAILLAEWILAGSPEK